MIAGHSLSPLDGQMNLHLLKSFKFELWKLCMPPGCGRVSNPTENQKDDDVRIALGVCCECVRSVLQVC